MQNYDHFNFLYVNLDESLIIFCYEIFLNVQSFAASVLTAEQLTVMKDLFAECDTNGDGTIDKEELKNTLQKFHRPTV